MAFLATHISASLVLVPIGVHRLLCSSSVYLQNPSLYRSKTWYFSHLRWKNFSLYSLLLALPIASFSEIFLFLTFSGHPTYKFTFFDQSAALSLFWVLLILIILRENMDPLLITESFLFLFAGIVFLVEYSVIGKGISGVGASVYHLLGGLTLVCASSCFYLSIRPSAFFAEFFLSSGLVFKGTWILQTGLSLYTDTFALKGCRKMSVLPPGMENADVKCDLEEDSLRGISLMNLLFVGHLMGVMILSFVLFGLLSNNRKLRYSEETSGHLLAGLKPDSVLMQPSSSEIEMA